MTTLTAIKNKIYDFDENCILDRVSTISIQNCAAAYSCRLLLSSYTTSNDATSNDATSNDATSNDATANDATSNDATSNDATSNANDATNVRWCS